MACLCKCGRICDCGSIICDTCDIDLATDEDGHQVLVIFDTESEGSA